jgi:hypothetical protein
MLDHGAFGTLLIGLEAVRGEEKVAEILLESSVPKSKTSKRRIRRAVAATLRSWADALEPARREPTGSGA